MFKLERIDTFNHRLNWALSDKAWKAVDLARKTGFSENTISQYRKSTTPEIERVADLANALQVNPVWLLGYNVEPYYDPDVRGLSKEETAVLYAYDNADEITQGNICAILGIKKQNTHSQSSKAASDK